MHNKIILSSCLFGSVYLYSKSLELINNLFMVKKKIPYVLIILNGLTFVYSTSIIIYSFYLLNFTNYNFLRR